MKEDLNIIPKIKLTDDQKERLEATEAMMPEARRALAALKRAGLNVRALEEKLDWADEIKNIMKEDFG